jgi:hypothetical protein
MGKGILASLATLVAGAGMAFAQPAPAQPLGNAPTPAPAPGSAPVVSPGEAGAVCPTPAQELPPLPQVPIFDVSIPDGPNAFAPEQTDGHHGPQRFWASADYLSWDIKGTPNPQALITTGTPASQGTLGGPGTSVLLGGPDIGFGQLSGGRFGIGFIDCAHDCAVELKGFWLQTANNTFGVTSDQMGSTVFARPFINSTTGVENVSLASFPGAFAGSITTAASSQLFGAEANLIHNVNNSWGASVDLLIGFRYLNLDQALTISQSSDLLGGGVLGFAGNTVLAPGTVGIVDNFHTLNQFYGGQIGADVEFHPYKRLFLEFDGKLGFGDTHQSVNATGFTSLSNTGAAPTVTSGGLLAVAGNSGPSSRDAFTFVPEIAINVGVDVTCNMRIYVGYTFLYWDNVALPGNQINRSINPATIPSSLSFGSVAGATNPPNPIIHSDFWAQGISAGVAFKY